MLRLLITGAETTRGDTAWGGVSVASWAGERLDTALLEGMGWKGCAGMQGADPLVWSEKDAHSGFALGVTLGLACGGGR